MKHVSQFFWCAPVDLVDNFYVRRVINKVLSWSRISTPNVWMSHPHFSSVAAVHLTSVLCYQKLVYQSEYAAFSFYMTHPPSPSSPHSYSTARGVECVQIFHVRVFSCFSTKLGTMLWTQRQGIRYIWCSVCTGSHFSKYVWSVNTMDKHMQPILGPLLAHYTLKLIYSI